MIDIKSKDEMGEIESLTKNLEKNLSISGKGEGFSSIGQRVFFRRLLDERKSIRQILEIGFNAGHSAVTFLSTRSDIHVTSLDLGQHECVDIAKKYVDSSFEGRHRLLLGDSKETLKTLVNENKTFDLIFIDGGHDIETAKSDLALAHSLSHSHTVVIMDDVLPSVYWGRGPSIAWSDAVREGVVDANYQRYQCKPIGDDDRRNEERLHCWTVGTFQVPHVVFGATRSGKKLSEVLLNHISSTSKDEKKRVSVESVDVDEDEFQKVTASVVDLVLSSRRSRKSSRVLGVIVGDSGIGVSIAANKFNDVRCALCNDVFTARAARERIDANILAIGSHVVGSGVATNILDVFLKSPFLGNDKDKTRLRKIDALRRPGKL